MNVRSVMLVFVFLFLISGVYAADYYVSNSGVSDWNNCLTVSNPCSLSTAMSNAVAGDRVYLRGGIYNQQLNPENSGVAGNHIIFTSFQGETATINGLNYDYAIMIGDYGNLKDYITITGLKIIGNNSEDVPAANKGGIKVFGNNIVIENCDISSSFTGIYTGGSITSNLRISNCDLYNNIDRGIDLGENSTNIIIEESHIYHNGAFGVISGCDNVEIRANDIHDNGYYNAYWDIGHHHNIYLRHGSEFALVEDNILYNTVEGHNLACRADNALIRANKIFGAEQGGILLSNQSLGGLIEIYNNLIYDNGVGIWLYARQDYPFNSLTSVNIYNNVIYNNLNYTNRPQTVHEPAEIEINVPDVNNLNIKNNIIYRSDDDPSDYFVLRFRSQSNLDMNYNLFYIPQIPTQKFMYYNNEYFLYSLEEWRSFSNQDLRSINTNPLFVDAINYDFHLQSDSPAIDAGIDVGLTLDFDGNAVPFGSAFDIGAYEFRENRVEHLDTNDLVIATFSTIQECANVVQAGETCLIYPGTYREQVNVVSSGAAGQPITFKGVEGMEKPVISGADVVTGWTSEGGNVWQATLTTGPNQVFFDNVRGINESSIGNLDSPNEWYNASNVIYVYSISDPNTNGVVIEASQRKEAIRLEQVSHVVVRDLILEKAQASGLYNRVVNIVIDDSKFINLTAQYNWENGILSFSPDESGFTDNGEIRDNLVRHNGGTGIWVSKNSRNWLISNNVVHHNSLRGDWGQGTGIRVTNRGTTNVSVTFNKIYNNGYGDFRNGWGIHFDYTGNNMVAMFNEVYDNAIGIVVEIGQSDPGIGNIPLVAYNVVYGHLRDGIFVLRNSPGAEIYNNILYDNRVGIKVSGQQSTGLGVNNTIVKNNIVFNNDYQELHAELGGENDGVYGSGNVYENNVFGTGRSNFIKWGQDDYSDYYDWELVYCGSDGCSNSVEEDPLFLDAPNYDFHLQPNSPAIDNGTDVGLTSDFEGNTLTGIPDIGAYEYQFHEADSNQDREISISELMFYITDWKASGGSNPTISQLLEVIVIWKAGSY